MIKDFKEMLKGLVAIVLSFKDSFAIFSMEEMINLLLTFLKAPKASLLFDCREFI